MRREKQRHRTFTRRAFVLGTAQLGAFGLLAARMYQLQVLDADRYATLAEDNRISPVMLPPVRGGLTDRFGVPLAINRQTYRVFVIPEQAASLEDTLRALGEFVPITDPDVQRVVRTARRQRVFTPITVRENLTWDEIARIAVHAPDLPGVQIDMVPQRLYPQGHLASHLVGYVGAVSEEDITDDPLLKIPEIRIGKAGVERTQDLTLRGRAGVAQVEVNVVGRVIRELRRTEGEAGRELAMTIDIELQRYTLERLGTDIGAAVIMDVVNGDVLAMVSTPTFDPNVFGRGIRPEEWNALLKADHAPLSNKAFAGQYAPGSTF